MSTANNSTTTTTTSGGNDGSSGGAGGSTGSSIEAEYNEIVSRRGWPMVFQDIRERSDIQARAKKFSTDESKKLDNRRLNRYRDVLPYDHSRVALKRGEGDYINANLVKMERAGRKYILCQGPLPLTVGHFWLMVWEHDSHAILMLNKLIEQTTVKCHQYWPAKIGEQHRLELADVQLSVVHLKCVEYKNFCKRTFRLTDMETGKSREVIQFHYTTWPDFGIPSSPVAFLQFLKEVRDSGTLDRDVGPPIIHCSAGIGRSGTFCLVDCCLVLVDKEGEDRVSVQDVLLELRQYRMGLIQTPDQLYFSYQAIIEGMKRMNNSSFEEFEELSVVSSSSQQNSDQEDNEDTPPPLPPPRTHSLTSKPLPVIPTSESVHEEFLLGSSNGGDRDKVNNLVNLEKSKQFEMSDENHHHHHHNNHHHKRNDSSNNHNHHHHPYSNRPLPPIVRDSSLYKVNELDSDGGGGGNGDGSSGSDGSDSNAMSSEDELIEENDSDIGEEEDDDEDELEEKNRGTIGRSDVPSDNSDNIKSSLLDESSSTTTATTTTTTTASSSGGTSTGISSSTSVSTTSSTTASAIGSNNSTLESTRGGIDSSDQHAFNANSSLPPLPNGALDDGDDPVSSPERELSPSAELRRRKRFERQSAMEEKIREIKRKRKEVESKGSPKKRRKQKEAEK
ncbi:tyrosine-protein phosphatase non-receptor type 61F isoform X2 [Anopheles maculipalpis]|uniref:tyrosine-protein phosphatase non-receptor type 61F isoform X2 n=1 Tax=Anopheles maculipalpis TaxID=1496333 RepID=UPI002158B179|nr:tyrosine-protein phosphatase non-receptor type 61F isoform X2 [Anopheles maculipalpis]